MRHVLVVANETLVGAPLTQRIHALTETEPLDVEVVVPVHGTDDSSIERATDNLRAGLAAFEKVGIEAQGRVGQADPMAAIRYSLERRPSINLVVVSTLPIGRSRWVAMDLPHRIQRRFNIAVEHIEGTAADAEIDTTHSGPVKVFLVDDNTDDIELATVALEGLDVPVDVLTAHTGANALEYIAEASPRPDLILLDLKMPVMDGFTMLEELNSRLGIDALNELNIVVVSSSAAQADRERAHALGARAYVVKQPDFNEFRSTIASLVAEASQAASI